MDEVEMIAAKVEDFRKCLDDLNEMLTNLAHMGLSSHFYIGPNKTYTYLPDSVVFKKTTTVSY